MTALLFEFAVRTALIAGGTAAVLWALRIKAASVRHAAWSAVVLTMLLLPISLAGGMRMSLPLLQPAAAPISTPPVSEQTSARPGPQTPIGATSTTASRRSEQQTGVAPFGRRLGWSAFVLSGYLAGAFVLLLRLGFGTVQANRLRRRAVMQHGRLTSDLCATPITVGWLRPALILPRGWTHWPAAQLDAVLTHERAHARRRDPLIQWLALLNRAVFWFHPLAWWLERRLAALAEEACDAAVLAAGHPPQDYSEYLLEMARAVSREHGRLHLVGMAMPGTDLTRRVTLIFQGLPSVRISRTRVVCTVACCAMSSAIFAAGTLSERAALLQPSTTPTSTSSAVSMPDAPATAVPVPSPMSSKRAPGRTAAKPTGTAQQPDVQATSAPRLQITFEVISIRPCESPGEPGKRGSNSPRAGVSPGWVRWGCVTLAHLIDQAWGGGTFPNNSLLNTIRVPPGRRLDAAKRIRGGPAWVEEERWAIEIKISGDTTDLTGPARYELVHGAIGPQLRAMLEDRFRLKLRKATEEQPMYALTVPKSGLKITPTAPEKCWERDRNVRPEDATPPPGFEETLPCDYGLNGGSSRGNRFFQFTNITLKNLAKWLSQTMDRYVLDKTGVEGRFSFRIEYAADDTTPGDLSDPFVESRARARGVEPRELLKGDGPPLSQALEALGLRLAPTRGPAEYLLIESVQRPRPN